MRDWVHNINLRAGRLVSVLRALEEELDDSAGRSTDPGREPTRGLRVASTDVWTITPDLSGHLQDLATELCRYGLVEGVHPAHATAVRNSVNSFIPETRFGWILASKDATDLLHTMS